MRLLHASWSRVIAAVTVVCTVLAAIVITDGARAATGRQAYLHVNMCGNLCNDGDLAVARNLASTIGAHDPYAVTLNEVCENQYEWLRTELGAHRGRFDPTGPMCSNGARYGNAILVRTAAVTLLGSWRLPSPAGGEPRRLMCLATRSPSHPSLAVCVTHISYEQAEIAAQIGAVADALRSLDGAPAVLFGGDLNTKPADARLRLLYSVRSGDRAFEEATPAGCDACHQHRIDYVFLSRGHWSATRAHAFDAANGLSDHPALLVTAVFMRSPVTRAMSAGWLSQRGIAAMTPPKPSRAPAVAHRCSAILSGNRNRLGRR